jgi:hypothetical protein
VAVVVVETGPKVLLLLTSGRGVERGERSRVLALVVRLGLKLAERSVLGVVLPGPGSTKVEAWSSRRTTGSRLGEGQRPSSRIRLVGVLRRIRLRLGAGAHCDESRTYDLA